MKTLTCSLLCVFHSFAAAPTVAGLLTSPLNSATAKVGDPVEIVTDGKVRLAKGSRLTSGTRLVGTVRNLDKGRITLLFDRAIAADGTATPIRAVVRAISIPSSVSATVFRDSSGNFGEMGSPAAPPPGSRAAPLGPPLARMTSSTPRLVRPDGAIVGVTYKGIGVISWQDSGEVRIFNTEGQNLILKRGTPIRLELMGR